MKEERSKGKGDGQGRRQGRFCSSGTFGQGRGGSCGYRRNETPGRSQSSRSMIEAVFDGLETIIDRSRRTIGLLSGKADPEADGSGRKHTVPPDTGRSVLPGSDPETKPPRITDNR